MGYISVTESERLTRALRTVSPDDIDYVIEGADYALDAGGPDDTSRFDLLIAGIELARWAAPNGQIFYAKDPSGAVLFWVAPGDARDEEAILATLLPPVGECSHCGAKEVQLNLDHVHEDLCVECIDELERAEDGD